MRIPGFTASLTFADATFEKGGSRDMAEKRERAKPLRPHLL